MQRNKMQNRKQLSTLPTTTPDLTTTKTPITNYHLQTPHDLTSSPMSQKPLQEELHEHWLSKGPSLQDSSRQEYAFTNEGPTERQLTEGRRTDDQLTDRRQAKGRMDGRTPKDKYGWTDTYRTVSWTSNEQTDKRQTDSGPYNGLPRIDKRPSCD